MALVRNLFWVFSMICVYNKNQKKKKKKKKVLAPYKIALRKFKGMSLLMLHMGG